MLPRNPCAIYVVLCVISIQYILGELLMLCHRYAPKPLLYHKRSFNKKVCRYTHPSIPRKTFGIGPLGATQDLIQYCSKVVVCPHSHRICFTIDDRHFAIRILTPRWENFINVITNISHMCKQHVYIESMNFFTKRNEDLGSPNAKDV